jgi:hypothetical protein
MWATNFFFVFFEPELGNLTETPKKEKMDFYVGHSVRRRFDGYGVCCGTVEGWDSPYFHIVYQGIQAFHQTLHLRVRLTCIFPLFFLRKPKHPDGDCEEMTPGELLHYIQEKRDESATPLQNDSSSTHPNPASTPPDLPVKP